MMLGENCNSSIQPYVYEEVPVLWRQVPLGRKMAWLQFASSISSSNNFECDGFLPTEKVVRYKKEKQA
jgi:hypothetical protein